MKICEERELAKGRQRVMSEMLLSCAEGCLISIETAATLHCQEGKKNCNNKNSNNGYFMAGFLYCISIIFARRPCAA